MEERLTVQERIAARVALAYVANPTPTARKLAEASGLRTPAFGSHLRPVPVSRYAR